MWAQQTGQLSTRSRSHSQRSRFVPSGNYAAVIEKLRPGAASPGAIVHADGRVLGEHERIGVADALRAITLGAAYTLKLDGEVGSIECGKRADFCVLDDDPLAVPSMALKDLPVWGVVQDGRVFAAADLPTNVLALSLAARQQDSVPNAGGSTGTLCVGGPIGRAVGGSALMTSASGPVLEAVDLDSIPTPIGTAAVMAGELWYFQYWHRDAVLGFATSNFTNGVRVVLP